MPITGEHFLNVFQKVWKQRIARDPQIAECFKARKPRTLCMCGKLGVLPETLEGLQDPRLEWCPEFYRIDFAAWRESRSVLHKRQYRQPLGVLVLIEHENYRNSEEEFWKLLHWYAPLKVLVCYHTDYQGRLRTFREVGRAMNNHHARNPNEEYLVLIGSPGGPTPEEPMWQAFRARSPDFEFGCLGNP